jgi:hypothetical protein
MGADDMKARTPAPEGEAVESFDAWLYGQEGYGLRVERLSEDLRDPIDKVLPWLKAAFDVGRASPVVPVGVRERVLDELDKAWLHGQRRTSWRRDESADAIMAALRPTDTGRE